MDLVDEENNGSLGLRDLLEHLHTVVQAQSNAWLRRRHFQAGMIAVIMSVRFRLRESYRLEALLELSLELGSSNKSTHIQVHDAAALQDLCNRVRTRESHSRLRQLKHGHGALQCLEEIDIIILVRGVEESLANKIIKDMHVRM
jgi:hypothetical protein